MSVDFNGSPVSYTVNGDRTHHFTLPRNRGALHSKVTGALKKADAAVTAEAEARAKDGNDHNAHRAANEKVGAAVGDVYDVASASSRARVEYHREEYAYAAAKFGRALAEAERALQALADHAQLAECPVGIGFDTAVSARSKTVGRLRLIADSLASMPGVPELGEA